MKRVSVITLVTALAACSGGTTAVTPSATSGSGNTVSQSRSSVTFKLNVPTVSASSAVRRSPQYISASTQSLVVTLTAQNGVTLATPQSYATNITSSACPAVSGTQTCTLAVPAAVGSDAFTVATYDAAQSSSTPTSATGNQLSTAFVMTTVVAGTANSVSLTLGGVVASVALALSNAAPQTGTAATIGVTLTAKDADGNVIVGSYANPITLTDSDTSGATTLSTTSVTSSSTAVSVAYNGNTANATFTATSPSASAATATLASAISKIWISSYGMSLISSFTVNGTPSTPTISNGLAGPGEIATDAAGNVYSPNYNNNTVTEYSRAGTLLMTISTGVAGPLGVSVDGSGKIYVLNYGSNSVTTYAANGTQTTPTISVGIDFPTGIAVDANGNIYVSNDSNDNVSIYYPNGSLKQTVSQGLSANASTVAVDANGKIYVGTYAGTVLTYTSAGAPTTPTISGLSNPSGIAVDFAGNIYVSNYSGQDVVVYSPVGTLLSSFPVSTPGGMAIF